MAVVKVFVCWDNRPEMRRSCWVSLGGILDWIGGDITCLIYKPTEKSCWPLRAISHSTSTLVFIKKHLSKTSKFQAKYK